MEIVISDGDVVLTREVDLGVAGKVELCDCIVADEVSMVSETTPLGDKVGGAENNCVEESTE